MRCPLTYGVDIRWRPQPARSGAYALPLTCGVDILHGAVNGRHELPYALDLLVLGLFCVALFALSLRNNKRRWII